MFEKAVPRLNMSNPASFLLYNDYIPTSKFTRTPSPTPKLLLKGFKAIYLNVRRGSADIPQQPLG
jgi:hypothetical protein